jgi:D-glycero-alpha-D-manno-heptose-7-phosphate kinase
MILTRTPLRICFFCGGSDMPSFYERDDGAALSVTINKFIYVFAHKVPHMGVRCMYDDVEEHHDIEQMQHAITRETLKYYDINKEITVASISDIVTKGSGLGSSSAFAVGLVKALSTTKYDNSTRRYVAEIACQIEMEKCGYPVGKQDQYAAAFGGFNLLKFKRNGEVDVEEVRLTNPNVDKLEKNLMLVYSGRGRNANNILQKQQKAMTIDIEKFNKVKCQKEKAYTAMDLIHKGKLDQFGELLHESWIEKKTVCEDITQDYFDQIYTTAINAGAIGGKLLGAGGGGFFLFYVPENKRTAVEGAICTNHKDCRIYDFQFYGSGSNVVYHHE